VRWPAGRPPWLFVDVAEMPRTQSSRLRKDSRTLKHLFFFDIFPLMCQKITNLRLLPIYDGSLFEYMFGLEFRAIFIAKLLLSWRREYVSKNS